MSMIKIRDPTWPNSKKLTGNAVQLMTLTGLKFNF
jgi:hypothetical protein